MASNIRIEVSGANSADANSLTSSLQSDLETIMPPGGIERQKTDKETQDLGTVLLLLLALLAEKTAEKIVEELIERIVNWLKKHAHRSPRIAIKDERDTLIVVVTPESTTKEIVDAVLKAKAISACKENDDAG
jgi:uncharacterized membrane-anchored protein YjiN (DUF445 family)